MTVGARKEERAEKSADGYIKEADDTRCKMETVNYVGDRNTKGALYARDVHDASQSVSEEEDQLGRERLIKRGRGVCCRAERALSFNPLSSASVLTSPR